MPLPWMIALAGGALALAVQSQLFGNIPHITDASSHWFQSRIFASGRLAAPAPPCPAAFFQHNVVVGLQDLWHTKYFPGQALWLIWPLRLASMPLAFGVFLLAAHRVMRASLDPAAARTALVLMAVSPLLLLLAGSFMSHMPLLMWMALAWAWALAGMESERRPQAVGWAAAAGFCAGMGLLTRPQDAVMGGLVILAALAPRLLKRPGRSRELAGAALAGLLPPLLFLLHWNHALYGQWLGAGYSFDPAAPVSQTPIIHDTLGLSSAFPLAKALQQSGWVTLRLNQALLGWPMALPLLAPGLCLRTVRRGNALLLLAAGWLYLPYFFFHYYGFELEARYAATAAPFLVIVLVRTWTALFRDGRIPAAIRRTAGGWLAAFCLYAAVYYWPAYLWPRYAGAYEESSPAIHQAAEQAGLDLPALVLLPDKGFVYTSGFIYNDPLLRNPILYARDIPDRISCLQAAFPGRHPYRYRPAADDPFRGRFERIAVAPAEAPARPPTRSYSAANASSPRSGE